MKESKEMKMLKELLRDTVYGREFDILAFMANDTCEALTHLREWIDTLKSSHDKLVEDVRKTCQMINDEGKVSKWKIQNWLEQALDEAEKI